MKNLLKKKSRIKVLLERSELIQFILCLLAMVLLCILNYLAAKWECSLAIRIQTVDFLQSFTDYIYGRQHSWLISVVVYSPCIEVRSSFDPYRMDTPIQGI